VIGWGRQDKVTLPSQAQTATTRFPTASLHWFAKCGHLPHWDQPQQAAQLILNATAGLRGRSCPNGGQGQPWNPHLDKFVAHGFVTAYGSAGGCEYGVGAVQLVGAALLEGRKLLGTEHVTHPIPMQRNTITDGYR